MPDAHGLANPASQDITVDYSVSLAQATMRTTQFMPVLPDGSPFDLTGFTTADIILSNPTFSGPLTVFQTNLPSVVMDTAGLRMDNDPTTLELLFANLTTLASNSTPFIILADKLGVEQDIIGKGTLTFNVLP